MWIFMPLILMSILFRRQMRTLALIVLVTMGLVSLAVGDFWIGRYDHWVDCGRPMTTVCPN